MSVRRAVSGWRRVSVIHISSRQTQWFYRNERLFCLAELLQLRANSTSTKQAGSSELSTSAEEAKLSQAQGPAKNEQNDLLLLETTEPEQSTESLTAYQSQIVVRMREKLYSRFRIAQYLGRHVQVVHDALGQLGLIDLQRYDVRRFRLSVAELERVESLRRKGITWGTIGEEFGVNRKIMSRAFTLDMKAARKPVPITESMRITLSSTDLQNIAALREHGKTWPRIVELKFKERLPSRGGSISA